MFRKKRPPDYTNLYTIGKAYRVGPRHNCRLLILKGMNDEGASFHLLDNKNEGFVFSWKELKSMGMMEVPGVN